MNLELLTNLANYGAPPCTCTITTLQLFAQAACALRLLHRLPRATRSEGAGVRGARGGGGGGGKDPKPCAGTTSQALVNGELLVLWLKQCHKPPMTVTGKHTTYGDDWRILYYCFNMF